MTEIVPPGTTPDQSVSGSSWSPAERPWVVHVDGFGDCHRLMASSASQARYRSFLAYDEAGYGRYSCDRLSKHDRFVAFSRLVTLTMRDCSKRGHEPSPHRPSNVGPGTNTESPIAAKGMES